ncbi:hypothetical protein CFP56_021566 [Quercus suber]|uniref:Uncharacterized protein n=1 Tax=Quercus suber TaxID=58331 RepID=A0AAW0M1V9_QUESU
MSSFQLPHDTKAANLVVLPTCLGCQYGGLWILQLSVGMHEFNLFLASAGAKPCNHYKRYIITKDGQKDIWKDFKWIQTCFCCSPCGDKNDPVYIHSTHKVHLQFIYTVQTKFHLNTGYYAQYLTGKTKPR